LILYPVLIILIVSSYSCQSSNANYVYSHIPGTSRSDFGVKPNGKVFVETTLEPQRTYTFAVFLAYEGLDYKGKAIEGEAAANVHVVTQGKLSTTKFCLVVFPNYVH